MNISQSIRLEKVKPQRAPCLLMVSVFLQSGGYHSDITILLWFAKEINYLLSVNPSYHLLFFSVST